MNGRNKAVKVFTVKQQFPCGPDASCCGPVGQSAEEIEALKRALQGLDPEVEFFDINEMKNFKDYHEVLKIFRSFGPQIAPIVMVGAEIVSMGRAEITEILSEIKSKL